MTASGSVSDFDDAKKTSLESSIAAVAGVDASDVTVAITPGSVLITATIGVPTSKTAEAVQTSLASKLGTADAASTELSTAAFSITVESVPNIAGTTSPATPATTNPTSPSPTPPTPSQPPSPSPPPPSPSPPPPSPSPPPPSPPPPAGSSADSGSSDSPPGATVDADDSTAEAVKGLSDVETNIEEGGGGGAPTAAIGGGAAVAILLMVGLGFLYLRKKRMAGSQSPVALTAISLTPTEEKDLESGSSATKGPTTTGETTTYSVELTKTPLGLGLSLTDDVVTEVKPDSQAARGGRIKVGHRGLP